MLFILWLSNSRFGNPNTSKSMDIYLVLEYWLLLRVSAYSPLHSPSP